MTHTYNVSGMACAGCHAKVQGLLSKVQGVQNVDIDLAKGQATIKMNKHVATSELQSALNEHPRYQLTENSSHHYFAYILGATFLPQKRLILYW